MSGTFVMMHGMTGTSAKMEPLAKQLVPKGWNIFCPEGKIPHPTRGGFAWWLRSEDPTEPLGPDALLEVKNSVLNVISEIPDGPIPEKSRKTFSNSWKHGQKSISTDLPESMS